MSKHSPFSSSCGLRLAGGAALLLLLAACAEVAPPAPERLALSPRSFADLPGWTDDRVAQALPALAKSCAVIAKMQPEHAMGVAGQARDWQQVCATLPEAGTNDASARAWFEQSFRPYQVLSEQGGTKTATGLFTGYYEPEVAASLVRGGSYQTPLYRVPDDLVKVDLGLFRDDLQGQTITGEVVGHTLKPFPDREEIDAGALNGKGYELYWAKDPVDAFFLEIQGSGQLVLPDGSHVRVGYAGQNGHGYVAIGHTLIERGALTKDNVSMPAIRAWLAAHPEQMREVLDSNPSVVFFRRIEGDGPIGAETVALTPGRSLAVDHAFLPYGVPLFLATTDPVHDGAPLDRLMIAQDTGGAIKGAIRGDVFWGAGVEAERYAGLMKQSGSYFLLLPKTVAPMADESGT